MLARPRELRLAPLRLTSPVKKIAIGCLGVVVLLLVAAVVFVLSRPTEFEVRRERLIAAPPGAIHALVGDLRTWPEWTEWSAERDPSASWEFEGAPGENQVMRWSGDKLGDGRLEIEEADPASGIRYQMSMEGGLVVTGSISYEVREDGTLVTWEDRGDVGKSLLYRAMTLFLDTALGTVFEKNLASLEDRLAP